MIEGWNKKVLLKDKGLKWWMENFVFIRLRSELERKAIKFMPFRNEKQMFSNSFTFYLSRH